MKYVKLEALVSLLESFDFYFEYPDVIPKAYSDFYNKALEEKKALPFIFKLVIMIIGFRF